MYLTGDNGYQSFTVFDPIVSSATLDNNKILTSWILTGVSSGKFKPFNSNFELPCLILPTVE